MLEKLAGGEALLCVIDVKQTRTALGEVSEITVQAGTVSSEPPGTKFVVTVDWSLQIAHTLICTSVNWQDYFEVESNIIKYTSKCG